MLTLRALIAAGQENERERLRQTQLPRSTYHAVRKRAYEEGWLRDRYVPDPLLFGLTHATFTLARPFADRAEELVRLWSSEPGCVLLWRAPVVSFAVVLHHSAAEAARTASRIRKGDLATEAYALAVPLREASVPAFFDYEGLFANMAGISGTTSYPRGLGGPNSVGARKGLTITSEGLRRTALELLSHPFTSAESGRPGHLLGPVGLPRSQRRLVEQGWVDRRVMPDLARIPPYQGRMADLSVFVRGELLPGRTAQQLLVELTDQCRVYPFLLVVEEGRVLVGAQGQSAVGPSQSVITVPSRKPVLPTLQGYLRSIEVVQVRSAELAPIIDHRYDRLLAPAGPAGPAAPPTAR